MAQEGNTERTVLCPVEGCSAEKLSRGIYLHVKQSKGDGHGPQGAVPDEVSFDDLETVGTQSVSIDYPSTRKTEQVGRTCPYCEEIFQGKRGVMIHLGRVAGAEGHPANPKKKHESEDFSIVHAKEDGSIIEEVDVPVEMPSTRHRRRGSDDSTEFRRRILGYIEDLRERGKHGEADRAENQLLD